MNFITLTRDLRGTKFTLNLDHVIEFFHYKNSSGTTYTKFLLSNKTEVLAVERYGDIVTEISKK